MTGTSCTAPKASCGTPSGWRAGGRCVRCRLAHNNDTNRRRGLTSQERYTFLTMLRAGKTVEEAAEAARITTAALAQAARRDGELRAALDGMPVEVQIAARRAEWLAALVRCGGNQTLAEVQAGLSPGTANNWRQADPDFAAAVDAIRAWLGCTRGQARKPRVHLSEEDVERLRELWANGATGEEIAAELKVDRATVSRWRKKLGLPQRRQNELMHKLAARFQELWASGASYTQISAELGISHPTISAWRKELGLAARAEVKPESA
ncbi:helix-turn-helix domain-containing protein [Streptomyces sp. NPDC127063]|uniref:helix-turn-helix domain-containing protein n=1 Tax=Streptomyces sp. NPDC127063 TaxID=3347123 RepID=UPI003652DE02